MPIATPPTERNKTRAIDLFTNREQPQQLFEEARAGLAPDQYRILVFYGVGGQGKTLLCEKLRLNLQHEQPHRAVWGLLDLYPVDFREAAHGLLQLRKSLGESGRIKFTAFDYAIATYWEKAYPTEDIEVALQGIIAQNEDTLTSVAENAPGWFGEVVEGGVIGIGFKVVKKLWKQRAKEQAEKAYPALVGLQQREQWEILHDLPMFFGWDLRAHRQGKNALQPIIFIDTYEALWADKQTKTGLGATETDAWLRQLVAESPGVLFVIFGRDKLTWHERFPRDDWGACLNNQHLLGGLSDADAESYLLKIPVAEPDIRRVIIEAAKGDENSSIPAEAGPGVRATGALPFYLDIEAQTYQKILAQGQTPTPQDFGGTYAQIIDRFLRYADKVEREILKMLSAPRSFDPALFDALAQHYRIHTLPNTYQELTGYSFIECGSDGRCRLHGLMRDHLYVELEDRTQTELKQFLFDWYDILCQPTTPKEVAAEHEVALREAVYHRDLRDLEEALKWFGERQAIFYEDERYAFLEPLYRWALALAETQLGPDNPRTAVTVNYLALLLKDTNRLAAAEPLMRRTLETLERTCGLDHPTVSVSLNNLVQLLIDMDKLSEAEPLIRRALDINQKCFGNNHPNVASTLNTLAALLYRTNRLVEAESLIRQAVLIYENHHGANIPKMISSLNTLASILQHMYKYIEAEKLFCRSINISESHYGNEHPKVADIINNLSSLLLDTNRLVEAEPLMRRVLKIYEQSYGSDHPNVAKCLMNLGFLLKASNRVLEAEDKTRRALKILEYNYGPEHSTVAGVLNNLAKLLEVTHRFTEAEELMRRALAINEKIYGLEHPEVTGILKNLGQLLKGIDRCSEAEELLRRALSIIEKNFGLEHPKAASVLNELAQICNNNDSCVQAAQMLRRVVAINEKTYGREHPNVAIGLSNLSDCLLRNIQSSRTINNGSLILDAERLARRSLLIFLKFTRTTGHEHPELQKVFNKYMPFLVSLSKSQRTRRLEKLERKSGYNPNEWRLLLERLAKESQSEVLPFRT